MQSEINWLQAGAGSILSLIAGILLADWLRAQKARIIDFFAGHSNKVVSLEGKWKCWYPKKSTQNAPHQEITLKQKGRRITGTIVINRWADESPANETLSFEGNLKGEKVLLTYYDQGKPDISFGAFLLQIQDNGTVLDGVAIGIEPFDMAVYGDKRKWIKTL